MAPDCTEELRIEPEKAKFEGQEKKVASFTIILPVPKVNPNSVLEDGGRRRHKAIRPYIWAGTLDHRHIVPRTNKKTLVRLTTVSVTAVPLARRPPL